MSELERKRRGGEVAGSDAGGSAAAGKVTRTQGLPVQRKSAAEGAAAMETERLPFLDVQLQAEQGAEAGEGKTGWVVFDAPRFLGDEVLADVKMGAGVLRRGDKGMAVTKIQAAIADAGFRTDVNGTFDEGTETAVEAFQRAKGLQGKGVVDQMTMWALDDLFDDHARDAEIARGTTAKRKPKRGKEFAFGKAPKELLEGTQSIDKDEKAEAQALLTPSEGDTAGGVMPEFKDDVGDGPYVDRLRAVVNEVIDLQFEMLAKGKADVHADPEQLHDMKDIAALAEPAQAATDAVFGSYARGKAIAGDKLVDRWADAERRISGLEATKAKGGARGSEAAAKLETMVTWRVQKILNESPSVRELNQRHGVVATRAAEKSQIDAVRAEVAKARRVELMEIQKGWPGAADPLADVIYVQLFKSADAAGNRAFMWTQFQTMIHEYLHTLCHSRYDDHAKHHPDPSKAHALREGMTDYLTKVVWSTVNTEDPALRAKVEGPFHDPTIAVAPELVSYDAAIEAEQVVGLVGARNAYAAYFLGHVELLGEG